MHHYASKAFSYIYTMCKEHGITAYIQTDVMDTAEVL